MKNYWIRITMLVTLLLVPVLPTVVRAQIGLPTGQLKVEASVVPSEIRPFVEQAVINRPADILPEGDLFVVGVFDQAGDWGFGSLAASVDGLSPDWGNNIWLITHKDDDQTWTVALQGTSEFPGLLQRTPNSLISPSIKALLDPDHPRSFSMQSSGLKFPWDKSQSWPLTCCWHSGNSLDFGAGSIPADQRWVLAASDGTVPAEVCNDSYQTVLNLMSDSGNTGYMHLSTNSVPRDIIGQVVVQGRQLGVVYDGRVFDHGVCTYRPNMQWNTRCGCGTGPHLHWTVPSRDAIVDGRTISCSPPFVSTNERITSNPNIRPNPPSLQSPTSDNWLGSRTITLSWSDGGDPDNSPRNYRDYYVEVWKSGWSATYGWTTNTSWQVTVPDDGAYSWRVQAGDGELGSWSNTWTFNVDAGPPNAPTIYASGTGCGGIQNNVWQNTCTDPAFTWSASDVGGSGIQGYYYCWSASPSCNPTTWTTGTSFDPPAISSAGGTATYYLNVRARDNQNHNSSIATFGVLYDGVAPTVSMQINGGAETTNQSTILLNLSANDTGSGVAEVRVSNNNLTWSGWQSYADTITWAIPALDRSTHTVYVQVRDKAGNVSAVASDTIYLELYPPMPHSDSYRICQDVVDTGGSVDLSSGGYSLDSAIGQPWATGADANIGADFSERSGFLSAITGCLPITYTWTGGYMIRQWVIASAGDLRSSATYRLGDTTGQPAASGGNAFTSTSYIMSSGFWAQITGTVPSTSTQPTPAPTPTPTVTPTPGPTSTPQPGNFGLSINNGDLYTNNPVVTVNVWAPNVTQLRLSNDGGYADQDWLTYQIASTWVLSTQGSYTEPRYVYAWFRDAQDKVYGSYFDDIIYDPITPTGRISILGSEVATVTLWLEAWDDNSGVSEMRISNVPTMTLASWQPYTQTVEWVLTGDVVYAQFRDRAGNLSPVYDTGEVAPPTSNNITYLPLILKSK